MAMFQRGETIICSLTVRDSDGDLYDPDASVKITITDGRGIAQVNLVDMTNDSVGQYHYDFNSAAAHHAGRYRIRCRCVDCGRTTIVDLWFELEDGEG